MQINLFIMSGSKYILRNIKLLFLLVLGFPTTK